MKNTMKKVLLLSVVAVLMACFAFCVSAAEVEETGCCGNDVRYTLYSDGKLVISGTGDMYSWLEPSFSEISDNIKSIVIEKGVTSIGKGAFSGCTSLVSVEAKDVSAVGSNAFWRCANLKTAIFNGTKKGDEATIGYQAFLGCRSLQNIVFPKNLYSIDEYAFDGCASLTNIELPKTTYVDKNGFYGCDNLRDVYYCGSEEEWIWDLGNGEAFPETVNIHFGYVSHTHKYKLIEIVSATCMNDGKKVYECTICGVTEAEILNKLSHSYSDEYTVDREPTCSVRGLKSRHCVYEDCTAYADVQYIDKTEHTEKIIEGTPATCQKEGTTEKVICGKCNAVIKAASVIGVAEHSYSSNFTVDKAATCSQTGSKSRHCVYDGCSAKADVTVIPKTSHTAKTVKAVPATCEKNGTAEKTVCSKCNATVKGGAVINATGHSYQKTTVKATTSADGRTEEKCTKCSKIKSRSIIKKASGIKLSASSFVYDGKVKKPSVTVKDSAGNALNKKDYKISYSNSKAKGIGKYKVTVTLKGNYTGKKVLEYSIVPKGTTIKSLKADSGAFTASWSKQTSQTTGYEIQYSVKKNFKSAKTVAVKKNKTVSKKITGLKAKTKYYVRIRTYKTVGKAKLYSSWSAAKSVTTKPNISIKLNASSLTLYTGASKALKASVYPSDVKVSWQSDKKSVATVSGGKIKAVKKGKATITASFKYKGKTYKATCKVTVKTPSLKLSKTSVTMEKGEKITLKATANPSGKIKWSTSDSSVVTVKNGILTAKKKGKATVTATFTLNGKKYKKECKVKVTSLLDIMEDGFTAELIIPSVGTENSYCQVKYTNHTGTDVALSAFVYANGKGCYNSNASDYVLEDGCFIVVPYYRDLFDRYNTKDMYLDNYSVANTSVDVKGKQIHLKFGTDGGAVFGYTEADIGVY